ncbi:hypothetical protein GUJ93_ZPchr0001g32286 [Zizania palustris]|uniref:Secreted protein n=1 Tax=Zizania palustris TaxID=103762 RepID=A0A8J5SG81_ZIZPA|nr:hypothetical protein GUJ93_ZPchr0001g32286 [Zizania palustris]
MWAGNNLRALVVFLVVQVCLLAMTAAPWTVHGRSAGVMFFPPVCCPRFAECCYAAGAGAAVDVVNPKP